ncbi:MAG: hypothetical protein ABI401_10560 [Candidatus Dormibacter sp.]
MAVQLANEVISDFPDGLWFVDLVPLSDATLVAQKVMAAVGVREQADRSAQETLGKRLRNEALTPALGYCEHLLDGVATLVDTLLRTTVELNVLTTSREALRLAGEVVWHVAPLAVPDDHSLSLEDLHQCDATRLFINRAGLNLPGFELTAENAQSVAEICRQLDGLPLAIELAAARIASMAGSDEIG